MSSTHVMTTIAQLLIHVHPPGGAKDLVVTNKGLYC